LYLVGYLRNNFLDILPNHYVSTLTFLTRLQVEDACLVFCYGKIITDIRSFERQNMTFEK